MTAAAWPHVVQAVKYDEWSRPKLSSGTFATQLLQVHTRPNSTFACSCCPIRELIPFQRQFALENALCIMHLLQTNTNPDGVASPKLPAQHTAAELDEMVSIKLLSLSRCGCQHKVLAEADGAALSPCDCTLAGEMGVDEPE